MTTIQQSTYGRYAIKLNALVLGVYSNLTDALAQQKQWQS